MRTIWILLVALLFASCGGETPSEAAAEVETEPIEPMEHEDVPDPNDESEYGVDPSDPAQFIPDGFTMLDSAWGDLNGDGVNDWLVVAKDTNESDEAFYDAMNPPARPMLVLIARPEDGALIPAARNDSIVLCAMCGGMMGDPWEGMHIENGNFSVHHFGGAGYRWRRATSFTFDAEAGDWLLLEDRKVSFHATDPEGTFEEIVETAEEFGAVRFEDYRWD